MIGRHHVKWNTQLLVIHHSRIWMVPISCLHALLEMRIVSSWMAFSTAVTLMAHHFLEKYKLYWIPLFQLCGISERTDVHWRNDMFTWFIVFNLLPKNRIEIAPLRCREVIYRVALIVFAMVERAFSVLWVFPPPQGWGFRKTSLQVPHQITWTSGLEGCYYNQIIFRVFNMIQHVFI